MAIGDVYLSRNNDTVGNTNPGYWNHSAIETKDGIVEAQEEPRCVILVTTQSFIERYPEIVILRYKFGHCDKIGLQAESLIGKPYKRAASIFFKGFGENCVSVVRHAYLRATGFDYGWKIPDDIYHSSSFEVIEHKKDYENWVQPKTWFEGRIK